jgi:hypothetical protein
MNGVFELLQSNEENVLEKTFEALIDIAKTNHKFMDEYFDTIYAATKAFMTKAIKDEDVDNKTALLSIEVWNFIFEAELHCRVTTG